MDCWGYPLRLRRFLPIRLAARNWARVAILLLLAVFLAWEAPLPARSANPEAVLQICPADTRPPCPDSVALRVGDRVELDLLLAAGPGLAATESRWLVGWELHLELAGAARVEVMPAGADDRPVQERGDDRLFLQDWLHLRSNARTANRRYYRIQNRYDPAAGRLDYSVVLAGYAPQPPFAGIKPLSGANALLLGRLELRAAAPGMAELRPRTAATPAFQGVILTAESQLARLDAGRPVSLTVNILAGVPEAAEPVPTATPASPAPALQGQVWAQSIRGQERPRPFNRPLTLTFWPAGAIPPWRGGTARPLAILAGLTADSAGRFTVQRWPPNVRPGETYDLRVKGLGSLSSLAAGVAIPETRPGPLRPLLAVEFSPLRDGDLNGDNRVDKFDVAALQTAFGSGEKDANFDPAADFNADGVVDGQDFSRMAANINRVGQ